MSVTKPLILTVLTAAALGAVNAAGAAPAQTLTLTGY
jgi:hypothetical protein